MNTVAKLIAAAAALGAGALAAAPAAAQGYYDNGPGRANNGYDRHYDRPAPYRGDRPVYGDDHPDYAYERPDDGDYDRPAYVGQSGSIAICPPGYHLGRHGALCWPN